MTRPRLITNETPCKCKHEKGEHYDGEHNCMRLCDCKSFVVFDAPATPSKAARPHHASWCRCARCVVFLPADAPIDDEPAPSTQRIPYFTPGFP